MAKAENVIPEEVWTQHVAILAKTGRGKTITAKGGAASLMKAGLRVGVVDPTAAWWGMRLKADGKSRAFDMVIFGGDHGDVPIDKTMGAKIGALAAAADWSWIVDISKMGIEERTPFMTGFAEALFADNRRRLNLFLDECHLYMPQQKLPTRASSHMTAACNNLVSGGRSRGLCITMISQRSAKVHKDSLSQAETLIALGMISPHDIAAVEGWVKVQGDMKAAREMLSSLPALPVGTGWVYAPELGMLKKIKFPMIDTFDSSRAPGVGDAVLAPGGLGKIDLEEIRAKLAPPGRKPMAVAKLPVPSNEGAKSYAAGQKAQERALADAFRQGREGGWAEGWRHGWSAGHALGTKKQVEEFERTAIIFTPPPADAPNPPKAPVLVVTPKGDLAGAAAPKPLHPDIRAASFAGAATLEGPLQRIVDAIKWWNVMGIAAPSHAQVGFIANYSHKSGTWSTYLSRLRSSGMIDGRGDLVLTPAGEAAARMPETQPSGEILRATVLKRLAPPLQKIMAPILDAYPDGLDHASAGEASGYSHQSGTWSTYLSRLRSLDLIEGRGELKAQEWLFP